MRRAVAPASTNINNFDEPLSPSLSPFGGARVLQAKPAIRWCGLPARILRRLELGHRLVHHDEKLAHRGFGFIAHVRDTERGALDFPVAAVNEEALVLDQLLQLGHVHSSASTGLRTIVYARQGKRLKALVREQREAVLCRPVAGHLVRLAMTRVTRLQALGKDVFELGSEGKNMADARRARRHA